MVGGKVLAVIGCRVGGRQAEAGLPWLLLLCGWLPAARLSSLLMTLSLGRGGDGWDYLSLSLSLFNSYSNPLPVPVVLFLLLFFSSSPPPTQCFTLFRHQSLHLLQSFQSIYGFFLSLSPSHAQPPTNPPTHTHPLVLNGGF